MLPGNSIMARVHRAEQLVPEAVEIAHVYNRLVRRRFHTTPRLRHLMRGIQRLAEETGEIELGGLSERVLDRENSGWIGPIDSIFFERSKRRLRGARHSLQEIEEGLLSF